MTCGAVIVAWNGEPYIDAALRSLLTQTEVPRRVVIVDNNSSDRSLEVIRALEVEAAGMGMSMTVIEEQRNAGFPAGANRGLDALHAVEADLDFAVLLNQDATLDPGWCTAVAAVLEADGTVGAVGSKILLPNRLTVQHAGGYLEKPRFVGRHYGHHLADDPRDFNVVREVEYVTAAAMAVRTSALQLIGSFDEVFSPGYYEDVDWCARARAAGWKVIYAPSAVAVHVESASFSLSPDRLSLSHRNRLIYTLPYLGESAFRHEFARAERQFFTREAPGDERRALGVAYLRFLLSLPDLVAAGRIPERSRSAELVSELIDMFGELRRDLLAVTR